MPSFLPSVPLPALAIELRISVSARLFRSLY